MARTTMAGNALAGRPSGRVAAAVKLEAPSRKDTAGRRRSAAIDFVDAVAWRNNDLAPC